MCANSDTDAVPKKRGPKTDVLEALLKRVDGLEAKLREKGEDDVSLATSNLPGVGDVEASESGSQTTETGKSVEKRAAVDPRASPVANSLSPVARFVSQSCCYFSLRLTRCSRESSPPPAQTEVLLDTYFARFHGKPFYIVDESSIRQRHQLNQLPRFLSFAISAVAARYAPPSLARTPNLTSIRHTTDASGHQAAAGLSEDLAARARREINTDEPSIDGLQALLLLVSAFTATGKGKKAYMLMSKNQQYHQVLGACANKSQRVPPVWPWRLRYTRKPMSRRV